MNNYLTYEKGINMLMRIGEALPNTSLAMWINGKYYQENLTNLINYIIGMFNWDEIHYSINKNNSRIVIQFVNGSILKLIKYDADSVNIRGDRYDFLLIDTDIEITNIFSIGRSYCIKAFPPAAFSFNSSKCNSCLCKTCAIAYENGGAEGCGDCIKCKNGQIYGPIKRCEDYYNPMPPKINYNRRKEENGNIN